MRATPQRHPMLDQHHEDVLFAMATKHSNRSKPSSQAGDNRSFLLHSASFKSWSMVTNVCAMSSPMNSTAVRHTLLARRKVLSSIEVLMEASPVSSRGSLKDILIARLPFGALTIIKSLLFPSSLLERICDLRGEVILVMNQRACHPQQ
jgi:hypothetical protein